MTLSGRWLAAVCVLVAGCRGTEAPRDRRIVAHAALECTQPSAELLLLALGDFASARAVSVGDPKDSEEVNLPFDLLGASASTNPSLWHGVGYSAPPDDVHLMMWSTATACTPFIDYLPKNRGGIAITAFDEGNALLVAGLDPWSGSAANDSAFALAWDTRTGERLSPIGMGTHRVAWATATPFARGALVAGGFDRKFLPARYLDQALVFRDGAFVEPPVPIGDARARHGAVVLASGDTLLVGGEDEVGALDSLVAITPTDEPPYARANVFRLGSLARARKRPSVLRLASDEILVAGGFDSSDRYVPGLEWFAKDGTPCTRDVCTSDPPELADRTNLAFVTLPGGGVLAVGGLVRSTAAPSNAVFWITAEGNVFALDPLTASQRGTQTVRLVQGSDGSPWLFNGTTWFYFDAWSARFAAPDVAPEEGPEEDMPDPIAVDPGLFVWFLRRTEPDLEGFTSVRGFRHGVRGAYTLDPDFIFADPHHLAPNVPPREGGDVFTDADGLHLTRAGSVVITDTTYADVELVGETSSTSLPQIDLGRFTIGSPDVCPWPQDGTKFSVTRSGASVTLRVGDRATSTCAAPVGRVPLGLHGLGDAPVVVKQLKVTRH